jgi:hypothetical protein
MRFGITIVWASTVSVFWNWRSSWTMSLAAWVPVNVVLTVDALPSTSASTTSVRGCQALS